MSSYTGNGPDYQVGEQVLQGLMTGSGRMIMPGVRSGILGLVQVNNPLAPARSNIDALGYSGLTDGALQTTGVANFMVVPVAVGDVVTNISMLVGATAAVVPTHQFGALYAGTGAAPALIVQTPDTLTAAIGASAVLTYTLTTPHVVTSADAPGGFLYVETAITASTMPTVMRSPVGAAAVQYAWFPKSPLFISASAAISVAGTANATIASTTTRTAAPVVVLW